MQLKVIKADGSIEKYLHTKIIGTITNALCESGIESSFIAEQLADAITYYLYNNTSGGTVSSSEIYSMIQAMLSTTGYDEAAVLLSNYHYNRELTRRRTEVVSLQGLTRWNKSQIVHDLVCRNGIDRSAARAIAAMVEEKILRIGLNKVPTSLIREIVEIESQAMLEAERQLFQVGDKNRKRNIASSISTDGGMDRERKGVCRVAV